MVNLAPSYQRPDVSAHLSAQIHKMTCFMSSDRFFAGSRPAARTIDCTSAFSSRIFSEAWDVLSDLMGAMRCDTCAVQLWCWRVTAEGARNEGMVSAQVLSGVYSF